jgi:hypothetical protein
MLTYDWTKNGGQVTVILMADGMPLPPLPPYASDLTLTADGMPLPPLPPNANAVTLMADGMPLPPLPPYVADAAQIV